MSLNAFATARYTEAGTEGLTCKFCVTSYDLPTVNGGSKHTVMSVTCNTHT